LFDPVIREIHEIREQLSDKFGGDTSAILADARQRQEKLGRRIVSRGELSGSSTNRHDGLKN
jgi:hypothetical protein